jgi:asparagine synthase (glutamine-hydrolysing)
MCGIVGFISQNPNYNKEQIIQDMLKSITHRGPDGSGYEIYQDFAIGMARLAIVDSKDHLIPIIDTKNHFSIVYNGEIYNHNDIRKNLKEFKFQTDSDTESALYSYIKNGVKSFDEHNGMYAFAILDKLNQKLILVRDKAGEKPLYYTQTKDFFAFASEIKALLKVIEPKINKEALSYKAYEFTTGKETLFKNIYQLEPGEFLEFKDFKFTVRSYWKIWDKLIEVKDDEKKILNHLSELVEDAILLRTKNSAYEYSVFVSGGVDSSLIASIAKPQNIYTAHYDYDDFDELEYAKLLSSHIKRDLKIIKPTKDDFLNTRKKIAYALDSPCTWTSFTLWMLVENAKKDGVKIVMSGEGADELFAGYHRYHLLHHDEQIHNLEAMKQYKYLIGRYYGSAAQRYAKLVNRYENKFDEKVNRFLEESIEFFYEKSKGDIVHFMGMNDFYTTMQVLLQMSDRVNMAHSIENRSPFLDFRLIQFAFSMPSKYKIKNGITKWALKEVAKKFIPAKIANRIDKRGFSAPVNKWFEWDKNGKYNRSAYKNMVYEDWVRVFKINE